MTEKRKLKDDIANNLSEYKENFEKILESIMNQCDSNVRRHDSQLIDNVHKIIQTDIDLKKNVKKMKIWKKRQSEIDKLEKTLAQLSIVVNNFAKSISEKQSELDIFISKANRLQKGIDNYIYNDASTIESIITTARMIGPAASGAKRNDITFPWMPDTDQMAQGVNASKTLELPAPEVAARSISLDPVIMTRSAVISQISSSSSGSDNEDSEE